HRSSRNNSGCAAPDSRRRRRCRPDAEAAAGHRPTSSPGWWGRIAWPKGSSCLCSNFDDGVRPEDVIGHDEILRRRAFADTGGSVVVRAVARAEIPAELTAILTLAGPERHAAEVGADTHRDQPLGLARLGPVL